MSELGMVPDKRGRSSVPVSVAGFAALAGVFFGALLGVSAVVDVADPDPYGSIAVSDGAESGPFSWWLESSPVPLLEGLVVDSSIDRGLLSVIVSAPEADPILPSRLCGAGSLFLVRNAGGVDSVIFKDVNGQVLVYLPDRAASCLFPR